MFLCVQTSYFMCSNVQRSACSLHTWMSDCSPNCCVIAGSLLCICLTFHNCIITRSVSSCKKRVHRNLQHMLRADRHLPLIMDLGGMASSSGCLDSPQHVGRHMLLWVNLIDWMAPNSQVQVSSGSQRVNPSKWRMSLGVGRSHNRLAWACSHMPLVSPSDISGCKLATPQGTKWHRLDLHWLEMWEWTEKNKTSYNIQPNSRSNFSAFI